MRILIHPNLSLSSFFFQFWPCLHNLTVPQVVTW